MLSYQKRTKAQLIEALATLREEVARLNSQLGTIKSSERTSSAPPQYSTTASPPPHDESRVDLLYEISEDAIVVCDTEDRITNFNHTARKLFGYTPEEVRNTHFVKLLPDLYQGVREWLKRTRNRGETATAGVAAGEAFRAVRKDGSEMMVEVTLIPSERGPRASLTLLIHDLARPLAGVAEALGNRRLLETVIDTLPHYLCVKDLDSRYMLFNEPPSAFAGRHTMDFTHRPLEVREQALADERRIFSGEVDRLDQEREAIFPDGRVGFLHSIKVPLTDEQDRIIGLVGIDNDITLRKLAEMELRESEERYRHLVDYSLQGIIVHTHRPLFANQRAVELFGYDSVEDLLSLRHIESIYHPDEREEMNTRRVRRLAGDGTLPSHFTLRCLRKDGTVAHMEVNVHQVDWRGQNAILCTYVDRTVARHNEERFRTLVEGSIQGILVHQGGQPFFANQALADIFGYSGPQAILTMNSIYDLVSPNDRERLAGYARRRADGLDAPMNYEFQGIRQDGTQIWLDSMATVVEWDDQTALLVTLTDVTERRRAEEERTASRQMFQDILDTLPLMISLKDVEGNYTWGNRNALETFRVTMEELQNKKIIDHVSFTPTERKVLEDADQEVLATGNSVQIPQASYTFEDGRKLDTQVYKAPMRNAEGKITGILTATQDLTELRRSQSETLRMAGAAEQAGDAIFITDTFGVIEYVNPAFERITGYSAKEALGKTPRLLKNGEHPPGFYSELWETLLSGGVWKGRYVNRKKSGELYQAESTHSAIHDAQGKITHFVAVHRDISNQIQLEDQLCRSQRMQALGTLTGGIAHDFNNILVPILGYAEILNAHLPAESKEHHYVSLIAKAAQRAGDLVSQILLFSRKVEGGRPHPSRDPGTHRAGSEFFPPLHPAQGHHLGLPF